MKIIDIYGKELGRVGDKTRMIDSDGKELYVGDTVKVSSNGKSVYSMVAEQEIEGMGGEVNPIDYSVTKQKNFDELKPGERYHTAIAVNNDGTYPENEILKDETRRELDKIIKDIPLGEKEREYLWGQVLKKTENVMVVLVAHGMLDEFGRIADFYYKYPRYRADEMPQPKKSKIDIDLNKIWKRDEE